MKTPKHHKVPKGRNVIVIEKEVCTTCNGKRRVWEQDDSGRNFQMMPCPDCSSDDFKGMEVKLIQISTDKPKPSQSQRLPKIAVDCEGLISAMKKVTEASKDLWRQLIVTQYRESRKLMLVELNKCINK